MRITGSGWIHSDSDLLAQEQLQRSIDQTNRESAILAHSYSTAKEEECVDHKDMDVEDDIEMPYVQTRTIGFQCDPDPLLMENLLLRKEIKELKDQLADESKKNSGILKLQMMTLLPSSTLGYQHSRCFSGCSITYVQRVRECSTGREMKIHPVRIERLEGRVSDRELTSECGILDLLEPGDSVMADKGFTISDLLAKRQCALNIPPFRGIKDQFTTEEVFQTQEIAQLRIHVERSIGRVKNFHILEGVLPLSIAPLSTKIFQTCCWLTNLDVPLVQDDINDL
ncbi:unnamed protein product [Mytilus coruscus]|uniref:DDE Tnp4 domain-containing protein n=1 Tax=Mytilus coruscus TaxID=42192 RepID=A0A6J8E7A6_MYTCO|nr:unnamed protein product [Mytilus coruscus]